MAAVRVDIRYIDRNDQIRVFDAADARKCGRVEFSHSLRGTAHRRANVGQTNSPSNAPDARGFLLVPHDTFVQPGIEQVYPFTTAVPASAAFVRIWSSFRYEHKPSVVQRVMLRLGRRLGLLQYSLEHVTEPHTAERAFTL